MRLLIIPFLLFVHSVSAQTYLPADEAGAVQFVIGNLGFDVDGSFKGLKGKIVFDAVNLGGSSFDVIVESATVNTSNNTRDKHLRGKDYFDTDAHKQIRITSTRIAKSVTADYYVLFARLSIRGVTKDISFPFKAIAESSGLRFTGSFKIKRRDFGVGGRSTISNDVHIKLNVLAKKL